MKQKTYGEKLKDPRWQKKRLGLLEKADWTCLFCGGAGISRGKEL